MHVRDAALRRDFLGRQGVSAPQLAERLAAAHEKMLLPRLRARHQHEDRARLIDPGEIQQVALLPVLVMHVVGIQPLGRAPHHEHRIRANGGHRLRPARGEIGGIRLRAAVRRNLTGHRNEGDCGHDRSDDCRTRKGCHWSVLILAPRDRLRGRSHFVGGDRPQRHRQHDLEPRPAPFDVRCGDGASVTSDNRAHDGESKTAARRGVRARARLVDLVEAIEDSRQVFR